MNSQPRAHERRKKSVQRPIGPNQESMPGQSSLPGKAMKRGKEDQKGVEGKFGRDKPRAPHNPTKKEWPKGSDGSMTRGASVPQKARSKSSETKASTLRRRL